MGFYSANFTPETLIISPLPKNVYITLETPRTPSLFEWFVFAYSNKNHSNKIF